MFSHLIIGNKIFVSLKNEPFLFWTRMHYKGGAKFSKMFRGLAHKERENHLSQF